MKFWTKEEVAKYLRVNPRTVERWLQDGALKGYKLGNSRTSLWRVSDVEVRKYLVKHQNKKK